MDIKNIDELKDRLITFILLTNELGKPSSKYIDDFINNFSPIISNKSWEINGLDQKFNQILQDKAAQETEGGIAFYKGIRNGWGKEEIREYIEGYRVGDNDIVKLGNTNASDAIKINEEALGDIGDNKILDTVILGDKDTIKIDKEALGDIGDDEMIKWLKHDCLIDVRGTTNDRGSFNGLIEYNTEKDKYIIRKGSKTTNIASKSWRYSDILSDLVKQEFLSPSGEFLKDYETKSLSLASSIITMRQNSYQDVYIHNSNVALDKARDSKFVYEAYIESGRSLK